MPLRRVLRTLAALAVLVAGGGVRAQVLVFEPGYVVVAGDTLRGAVGIGGEAEAARGVRFRPGSGAEPVEYGVAEVSAFGADGGREYRVGRYATDPSPDAPLARRLAARVARDGAADLLVVEVVEGRPAFFLQTDGEPVGLYLVVDEVASPAGLRQRERPLFRQALAVLLGGPCAPDVEALRYTEPALAAAVDAYNACVDPAYVGAGAAPVRTRARLSVEVGAAVAGGSFQRAFVVDGAGADPPLRWGRVYALAELTPPSSPYGGVRPVAGVEYERGVVRLATGGSSAAYDVTDADAVHARVGLRLVADGPPVRLRLGVGGVAGLVFGRVVETGVPLDVDAGVVEFFSRREFETSLGTYVEAGVGLPSSPVDLSVRAQRTQFQLVGPLVPVDGPYGTRSLSVGLSARF